MFYACIRNVYANGPYSYTEIYFKRPNDGIPRKLLVIIHFLYFSYYIISLFYRLLKLNDLIPTCINQKQLNQ